MSLLQGTRNKRPSLTGHPVFVETTLDWNPVGDYSPHRAVLRSRGSQERRYLVFAKSTTRTFSTQILIFWSYISQSIFENFTEIVFFFEIYIV